MSTLLRAGIDSMHMARILNVEGTLVLNFLVGHSVGGAWIIFLHR